MIFINKEDFDFSSSLLSILFTIWLYNITLNESKVDTNKLPKNIKRRILAFPFNNIFIIRDDLVFFDISSHWDFTSFSKLSGYNSLENFPKCETSNSEWVFDAFRALSAQI